MDKCAIRGSPIHGVSRLLLTWWPAFAGTNINMSLAVLRGGHGTCDAFKNIGVNAEDLGRSKVDPGTIFDLVKIIKRDNIHILHCHGYGATTFGRIAAVLAGIPVIVQEHMVDINIPLYQRMVDKILSPLTSRGIAVSNAVNDFMVNYRSINKKKMQVVYNTIPEKYCDEVSAEEKEATRKKHNLPKDKILIGIIGRLDKVKGHKYFFEAAKIVLKERQDVLFVVIGDGDLRDSLESMVVKLGIEGNVKFLGHCNDILPLTSLLDIFVSTSLSEGLPMAHAEAMAQQLAIVATAVGGVPEIIEDNKSGLLVPAKDSEKIASAILRLLQDKILREKLTKGALERCRDKFLVPRTVSELTKIYTALL